jgi:hypothetical protein
VEAPVQSEVISIRTGNRPVVQDISEQAAAFVHGLGDGLLHIFYRFYRPVWLGGV